MSKLVDDVKSGLKGIRGAGDAFRGGIMEATDQAFDKNPTKPTSVAKQQKNRAVTEKGKQDIRGADEMIARHEWERKGVAPGEGVSQGSAHTAAPTGTAYESEMQHDRPHEGVMPQETRQDDFTSRDGATTLERGKMQQLGPSFVHDTPHRNENYGPGDSQAPYAHEGQMAYPETGTGVNVSRPTAHESGFGQERAPEGFASERAGYGGGESVSGGRHGLDGAPATGETYQSHPGQQGSLRQPETQYAPDQPQYTQHHQDQRAPPPVPPKIPGTGEGHF